MQHPLLPEWLVKHYGDLIKEEIDKDILEEIIQDAKELKECPFCASPSLEEKKGQDSPAHWHSVNCKECGAKGPVASTSKEAMKSWDKRRSL